MAAVDEGRFSTGQPYLKLGQGPPLFVLPGLTSEHANPKGRWRKLSLSWAAAFAEHFTVYLAQRRPGLPVGASLADIAADYAGAIEKDVGAPVAVHGTSSGGSVALSLAINHPQLVTRMVVAAAACRLSPKGKDVQAELARLTEAGEPRKVGAFLLSEMSPGPLKLPARAAGWLAGSLMKADDPSDMLVVIAAEDVFDAEPELGRITAPTLVLGGDRDPFYSEELFRQTAAGIPNGEVVIFPGKSHMYAAGSKVPAGIGLGFLLS
ncbi:MAG TPA: alpha/beta hydrolase [Nocardioidaceae bacterium]|nr:alpha/beta hydrolase [Nocardioidaceae bacterium]